MEPAAAGATITAERRWPMALAVIAAVALQLGTPHGGRIADWWIVPLLELIALAVLIARDPGRIDRQSPSIRRLTVVLALLMTLATISAATNLIIEILRANQTLCATNLLGRGAAVWFTNVIVFSIWYWEFDRGGPAARGTGNAAHASFAFPEDATPELAPPDWIPRYPDYLYLAFTNATAFSPTDTLPVRTWAKMTMMLQSATSLVLAVLVVARAINVVGGPC